MYAAHAEIIQAGYLTANEMRAILGKLEWISELIRTVDIDMQNNVGDTALIRASEVGKLNWRKHIKQHQCMFEILINHITTVQKTMM